MSVTVDEIALELRRTVTDNERSWIGQALQDVGLQVRMRFGDRAAGLEPDVLDFWTRKVVAQSLVQAGRPDGVKSQQISIDDGSTQTVWESARSSLWISDDWWSWLDDTLPGGNPDSGAFSIRLDRGRRRAW